MRKNRGDDDDEDNDKNRSEIPTHLAVEKEGETGGEKVRSFKISREAGDNATPDEKNWHRCREGDDFLMQLAIVL